MKANAAVQKRYTYRNESPFPKGSIQRRWDEFPLAMPELVNPKYPPVPYPIPDEWLAPDDPMRVLGLK